MEPIMISIAIGDIPIGEALSMAVRELRVEQGTSVVTVVDHVAQGDVPQQVSDDGLAALIRGQRLNRR